MDRMYSFFCVQLKRILKILPMQLLVNLVVCVCVGILAAILVRDGVLSPERQKYRIGVVGDMTDPYLGFGIQTLQMVDDSRFMVELISMSEEEARDAFRRGELYAFIRIPDGLIESIEWGTNDRPVTYVATEGQKGIGSIVMNELVDVVSNLVTCSQSGIYGMQKVLVDYRESEGFWEATKQLNFRYFDVVLSREKLYSMEVLGVANGLSTEAYYFCSILIFFLLLSGINNSLLFSRRNEKTFQFLAARGIGAAGQTLGEYLAYVCLMFLCVLEIFLILAVVFYKDFFHIAEWKGMGAGPLGGFLLHFLLVIFMIASMQFLLYELVSNIVSSILLQFLCGISMGYLSGFFYPASFFPETLQRVGAFLPTGAALRYMNGSITGNSSHIAFVGVLLYLFIFLGLSVLVRKNRIQRG